MIPAPAEPPARRTSRPLPVRRFLPGTGPNPVATGELVLDGGFDWACDLFDHRYYWEAHEVWEAEWTRDRRGPPGRFLQGLICGAAFVIKHHQGHTDGAERLLERARTHLRVAAEVLGPRPRGIDVAALLAALEAFRAGGRWPVLPRASSASTSTEVVRHR